MPLFAVEGRAPQVHPDAWVAPGATIGHLCVVHGCTTGREALVGNGAVVQDDAVVGDRALVAAASTVTPGTVVPAETVVTGTPARVRGPLEGTAESWVDHDAAVYRDLAQRHAAGVREVPDPAG